jgi:hypothetical protein
VPRRLLAAVFALVLCCLAATPAAALERNAFGIPLYDLHAIVDPHEHALSVEGTITLRNLSAQPQSEAALQISSSLQWLAIYVHGSPVEWLAQSYTSDIDHTGLLSEAIVKLSPPLAPGQSVRLRVRYSGTVTKDATRLTRIGTPPEIALRSDWDQISDRFTALRGAGYVVWYPVSIEAASLSAGDELYDALRGWRRREQGSVLRLHLARAAASGGGDAVAATSGAVFVGNGEGKASGAVLDQQFSEQTLTSSEPVLVLLDDCAATTDRPHVSAYYTAAHTEAAREQIDAAEAVMPPLKPWFGAMRRKVVIVELTDPRALPYESGSWYFTPLRRLASSEEKEAAQVAIARAVAHASFDSPRPWIREGLASFAQALVREAQAGRGAALAYLGHFRSAIAEAERQSHAAPPQPGAGQAFSDPAAPPAIGPQPLISTADEIFYRSKAAYVWWMLRDQLGDRALQGALAAYRPSGDGDTRYMERLLEEQLAPKSAPHRTLQPFFDDWVYRDRGLPRLRVLSAYTRTTLGAQTVTAVTVENRGDAGCEVPVLVRSANDEARQRLYVPAKGKAIVRVPMAGMPTEAVVNDGSVPEADDAGHRLPVTVSHPSSP